MITLRGTITEVKSVPYTNARGEQSQRLECTMVETGCPEGQYPNAIMFSVFEGDVQKGDIGTVELATDVQFSQDRTRKYNTVKARNWHCEQQATF